MNAPGTHHYLFDTAIGACGVAWNAGCLVGVQLPEKDRGQTELRLALKSRSTKAAEVPPWVQSVISDIQRHLAGLPVDFSLVAIDLGDLDAFRLKLYAAVRGIGRGHTVTYGELARELGLTGWEGARDVGEAMGKNPMPIVIPCHRVLAAGGKTGGFSAYGGASTKQKLLALEGICVGNANKKADAPPRLPGL
jgi:methylated-DNA-[protein]-cysteine S-methyltransferase